MRHVEELVAATDTRHYATIADAAYRFNPMVVSQAELSGFHGPDERVRSDGLIRGVKIYVRLLRRLQPPLPAVVLDSRASIGRMIPWPWPMDSDTNGGRVPGG